MRLRDVLTAFEQAGPMSLTEMAQKFAIEPGMLESMIQFWVHKGKLREVNTAVGCAGCNSLDSCGTGSIAVGNAPRRYELVRQGVIPLTDIRTPKCCR